MGSVSIRLLPPRNAAAKSLTLSGQNCIISTRNHGGWLGRFEQEAETCLAKMDIMFNLF